MSGLDRYLEEMCQIVWIRLLASTKAADMKKSHFLILDRSSKCCLGLWIHLSALLLLTIMGPVRLVSTLSHSPTLVPEYRLALNMPVSVSTLLLRTVVYYYAASI